MKAIVQNPGESPKTVELSETLKDLQGLVGGYVTTFYVPEFEEAGITAWANDEGLLIGQQPNLFVYGQPIVGPVVFTGHNDEGETVGLTGPQEALVRTFLSLASLDEARAALIALRMGY